MAVGSKYWKGVNMALGTWFLNRKGKLIEKTTPLTPKVSFVVGDSSLSLQQGSHADFFLTQDKSLMYGKPSGDYSVLLGGNWRFELIADSSTGLCVKIQCFLDKLNIICAALDLPPYQQKNIYVTSDEPLSPTCGCHYFPFEDHVFWDPQKHILCVGNPNRDGESVEFTSKTVAVIKNGELQCVYLILDGVVDVPIFNDLGWPK